MKDLRKAAKGRDCQARFPGYCAFDAATTVLCHVRRGGIAGVGQKPCDLAAFIGCHVCHDIADGRRKSEIPDDELNGYILDAVCRTLAIWNREGYV